MIEVEMTSKDQKNLKWISRLIAILIKIGRILLYIGIVGIIIAMSVTPTIINHTTVKENKIKFAYSDRSFIIKKDGNKTVYYSDGKKIGTEKDTIVYDNINKYFDKYSKKQLIGYSEAILAISMFITTFILKYVENIFNNIYREDNPYTSENLSLFKNIIIYKVVAILIPFIGMIAFDIALKGDNPFKYSSFSLLEFLMMIACYYIFKYGCTLKSNNKN